MNNTKQSYIGIDYGTKRVGIAVSDDAGRMAFPLEVVEEGVAIERVVALVKEREAQAVIVGESKDLSGRDNPVMERVRRFADSVAREAQVPVHFEPELFTSAMAARPDRGEHPRNARKGGGLPRVALDASAAALILQSWLGRVNK
ncbi:MAG TPA: Holliday junction resolvase RuvX [Candidatus Paceibacterota bacterium]